MIGVIYKWTNKINNKSYIGQTLFPNKRINSHINAAKNNSQLLFHKALRKYGIDSFIYEELESVEENKLNEREMYWISYYDSYNNGYNMTLGGEGHRGKISEEGRKHIALGHIGIKHTEEEKKKISESHKKYWDSLSDNQRKERISKIVPVHLSRNKNGMYKKHHKQETKNQISETKRKNYIKRIWVNKDLLEKLIPVLECDKYIASGWHRGRK